MEEMVEQAGNGFWAGKRVLVTGHTGFKGGWLALWLLARRARVSGLALPPAGTPSLFAAAAVGNGIDGAYCDIRDGEALADRIRALRPEIVFHLAAQPLVRAGYRDPVATFATNLMGTVHLLDALRRSEGLRVAVMVTTDKVYRNQEWPYPYREDDPLGGHDPYSASKAASEIAIAGYRDSFLRERGVAVASARAGNVIGGGDWSEDRLIPDAVRAWQSGRGLEVRRPSAVRPWQHVLEPLSGYLALAERLWRDPELAGAYNFGPDPSEAATVRDVVEMARAAYGRGEVGYGDGTDGPHEAGRLALETAKAGVVLGCRPKWRLETGIARTMAWYKAFHDGADARGLCLADIMAYEGRS